MIRKQYSQEQMDKILAVMPDEMTAFKIVVDRSVRLGWDKCWSSCYAWQLSGYTDGLNTSTSGPGYHFFVKKEDAIALASNFNDVDSFSCDSSYGKHVVLELLIKKQDIVVMGANDIGGLTITVSRMTMPIYPATEVVEEAPDVPAEAIELMELAAV